MRVALFILLLLFHDYSFSQSLAGITNIPDTSFTVQKEFEKQKKNYSQIQIAQHSASPNVIEKKDIVYCTTGNRKLLLDAFIPAQKLNVKRAAILIIHGGGWRSGNKAQHHPLAQQLAEKGYVCFTPEYRLSTEALYPAAVHDLKAAVRWIHANAKTYNLDTSKIAVAGFSAGGELAAFLGTTMRNKKFEGISCNISSSGQINAVIDMDGTLSFVHPESGEGDDSKKTSAATYWFGYSKKANEKLWHEASPLTHVGETTAPTLFVNSSVERMHAGREDFIKVLNQHNIYSEVKTFEGAPHSFPFFHPWFDSTVQLIDSFLLKIFSTKATTKD